MDKFTFRVRFDINHVFPPKNAFIHFISWYMILWKEWREERAMGKQETEQVTTLSWITLRNHDKNLLCLFTLFKVFHVAEESIFFLLSLVHHHLNGTLRKWHSSGESRLDYFLFSPHVWPLSLLFTSDKPSKSQCLFLSDTENNSEPSTSSRLTIKCW